MSRVVKTLRRMMSWSRSQDEVPQLPKETAADPETKPAAPESPEPFKPVKRKYAGSDDEDNGDAAFKKQKADLATSSDAAAASGSGAAETVNGGTHSDTLNVEEKKESVSAAVSSKGDDEEPAAAPDTPEADAVAERPFVLVDLDESAPNVFLTWADGLLNVWEAMDADEPVLFLKSQVLDAYSSYTADDAGVPEDRDPTVGYWGVRFEEDDLHKPQAAKFRNDWNTRRSKPGNDAWWWELTVVRKEPKGSKSRIKAHLESSAHNEDHEVAGGHDIGEWWIVGIKEASPETAKIMQMHRDLY